MNFDRQIVNYVNETSLGKDLSEKITIDGLSGKEAEKKQWNVWIKRSGDWNMANKKPMSYQEAIKFEERAKKSGIKIDDTQVYRQTEKPVK